MLAKQGLYCLNHTCSPFCSGYFGDGGLENYLPGLASNWSSQVSRIDYRCEPPAPSSIFLLMHFSVSGTLGVVVHICNSSTLEAEAGGWRIWGQPGLGSKLQTSVHLSLNTSECILLTIVHYLEFFFNFSCKIYIQWNAQILSVHLLDFGPCIHL
jgi:hypothetical protein